MNHHAAEQAMSRTAVLLSSAGRGWQNFEAEFVHIRAGRHEIPGGAMHRVGIHMGAPVKADCQCDGKRSRRMQKHGDIDVVPAGIGGSWQDEGDCRVLRLRLAPSLLDRLSEGASAQLEVFLQRRDPRIEAIGFAVKAELEAEIPSDPLYGESLGLALASRLLAIPAEFTVNRGSGLLPRQHRHLVDYIEANLDRPLSLDELAGIAGIGLSQFKLLFPRSFGMAPHRYVMQRRVEAARDLVLAGHMASSEIALATGFSHQSHMSIWMRRLIGFTPRELHRQQR